MADVESVVNEVRTARLYTLDMLKHIDDADWYRQPQHGVTHVAWQVGHLATAEYSLGLKRIRGAQDADESLIPQSFRQMYGKGSTPQAAPDANPAPDEIRSVLKAVHQQVLSELTQHPPEMLQESAGDPAHPMFTTKLDALRWLAQHEFIHIGQIALLRRLMGSPPLR